MMLRREGPNGEGRAGKEGAEGQRRPERQDRARSNRKTDNQRALHRKVETKSVSQILLMKNEISSSRMKSYRLMLPSRQFKSLGKH